MRSNWSYKQDSLFRNDDLFLKLPSQINKLLILENSLVLLLSFTEEVGNQNVFCYDFTKKKKWQIPAPIEFHDQNDFTGIYLRDSELYAYNRNGVEYHLNKESGEIIESQLIK